MVTPTGAFTEYPIPTSNSGATTVFRAEPCVWFAETEGNKLGRICPPLTTITEFPLLAANSKPVGITRGFDGNIWFTEVNRDKIARIYPDGLILEEPAPTGAGPYGLVTYSGALWFTELHANAVGWSGFGGEPTEHPIPTAAAAALAITAGPGGPWLTETDGNKIARITVSPYVSITEYPVPTPSSKPSGICEGPDHNVWFTEAAAGKIARYVP